MIFLIYGVLVGASIFALAKSRQRSNLTAIICSVLSGLFNYWIVWAIQPEMSLYFFSNWFLVLWLPIIFSFIFMLDKDGEFELSKLGLIPSAIFIILCIVYIAQGRMFNASSFQEMLSVETVSEEALTEDIAPISNQKTRVVDRDLASLIAEKDLGQITSLGSRCEIGEMFEQKFTGTFTIKDGKGDEHELVFDNDFIWVAPLEFTGYWKQEKFKKTEGFVLVSATNPNIHYLITEVNGRKMELKYLREGYFSSNLERYVRNSGYSGGLTEYSLELSEEEGEVGMPKFVITSYKHKIGMRASDATGIVIVDPINGEIKDLSLNEVPAWVDRVHPERFVLQQISDYGDLINGYINFSNNGKLAPTSGCEIVFNDNLTAYYTGMQSVGSDKGTNGFILVDTRTKKAKFYTISGANEDAAREAAEQAKGVKEAGYCSTMPKLYNTRGIPTYFMTLKSQDGQVKMYAYINLKNYGILGVGVSLREAQLNYQNALANSNSGFVIDDVVSKETITTKILDIVYDGTSYYLLLKGIENIELYGSSTVFKELKWAKTGDDVKVYFSIGEEETSVPILDFDLLRLEL